MYAEKPALFLRLILAPCLYKNAIASSFLLYIALIRGEFPSSSTVFTSAPLKVSVAIDSIRPSKAL